MNAAWDGQVGLVDTEFASPSYNRKTPLREGRTGVWVLSAQADDTVVAPLAVAVMT